EDFKISGEVNNQTAICNSLPAMDLAIDKIGKYNPKVLNDEQKNEIYEFIKSNQKTGKEARLEHKEQVKSYNIELERMKDEKICPYCKIPLVERKGKYGSFYGCKNYPKCKYTLKK
ncbi:MAG: topoisomerase DNA-binding C4 zinc finger domain-containing protein, partial [Firmicutes bacterium]|nr:topoisomerase DNA-binding C4 zinc finger domain-containing protein [Bacillota bacterium]